MASVARGTQWVKDQTGPLGQRLPTWRPRDLGPLQEVFGPIVQTSDDVKPVGYK
ncbi:hypothetical protein Scep_009491 [Stephania cephalantha]|uniref:Uncharacterized protein n=1 Tax=Stephania cephalantha TaxID=152367 RepID=A0AAP0PG98_9MAGN